MEGRKERRKEGRKEGMNSNSKSFLRLTQEGEVDCSGYNKDYERIDDWTLYASFDFSMISANIQTPYAAA